MLYALMLGLVVAVVFVNGWTDAPNAIACAVSTGAMSYRRAAAMAAACNLLGILVMQVVSRSVTDTVLALADFSGNPTAAPVGLCAAMCAIVLFAVAAWAFGIPTSESHALIAALSGAALALGGGVNAAAWGRVLAGLVLSVLCGGGLGWLLTRLLDGALGRCGTHGLGRMQVAAAGGMAFMHGAQDGQKFLAVFLMVDLMARGQYGAAELELGGRWGVLVLCALTMALGTSLGGGRIVEMVGSRMVRLNRAQGVCADAGGALSLLLGSLWGVPMSTTHTKTTAMMGAGLAGGGRVDRDAMRSILLTWVITFPACGLLGWALSRLLNGLFVGGS